MIRFIDSDKFSSQDGYPSAAVLREAHRLADKFPAVKAREFLREYFDANCRCVLGKGDREELLEDFLAERERSRLAFLEGSGLARDPEIPGRYLPGSWRLTTETDGQGCRFVINGVRRTSGEAVAVRLTVKQFCHAGASLRVIRKAVGAGEHIGLTATEWRRIWEGCDVRSPYGIKQWSKGLRLSLNDQLWEGSR